MNLKIKHILVILLLAMGFFAYNNFFNAPKHTGIEDRQINPFSDPIQENLTDLRSFDLKNNSGDFKITPVAKYKIAAKVMSRHNYILGWEGKLVPVDLALAWGKLVYSENDKYIHYSQGSRWYYYTYSGDSPLNNQYIYTHSANHHIFPANDNILKAVNLIKTNQIVELEGFLIYLKGKVEGRDVYWNSSLTRMDTGDNSCEFFYVDKVRIGNQVYR